METILFLPSCDCLRYYNLQWITSNQCDESRWNLHGVKWKSEWKWDYVSTQEVLWQGVCMAQLASRGYCSLQTQYSLKINVSGRRIIDIDASINVTFSAEASWIGKTGSKIKVANQWVLDFSKHWFVTRWRWISRVSSVIVVVHWNGPFSPTGCSSYYFTELFVLACTWPLSLQTFPIHVPAQVYFKCYYRNYLSHFLCQFISWTHYPLCENLQKPFKSFPSHLNPYPLVFKLPHYEKKTGYLLYLCHPWCYTPL